MKYFLSFISSLICILSSTYLFASNSTLAHAYCLGNLAISINKTNQTFSVSNSYGVIVGEPRGYKILDNRFIGARGTEGIIVPQGLNIQKPSNWAGNWAVCIL